MKQLTLEQIKAMPEGSKVLVEMKTVTVEGSRLPILLEYADGQRSWLPADQPIYLADDTDEVDELAKELNGITCQLRMR